jgi:protein SCO1
VVVFVETAACNRVGAMSTRRHCLTVLGNGLVLATVVWQGTARAGDGMGPVTPPTAAPDIALTDHLGRARALPDMLAGHVSVVQTMFTGCSSVCPIQGAVFAEVQRRLAKLSTRQPVQLLSLSIDPLGDSPAALKGWLARLQAQANWSAAVPTMAELAALQGGLDGNTGSRSTAVNNVDAHSDRLYFFDTQARLCWRSGALPGVNEVLRMLSYLAS